MSDDEKIFKLMEYMLFNTLYRKAWHLNDHSGWQVKVFNDAAQHRVYRLGFYAWLERNGEKYPQSCSVDMLLSMMSREYTQEELEDIANKMTKSLQEVFDKLGILDED